jgi:peptidoglycan DL-endopeptidase LytE
MLSDIIRQQIVIEANKMIGVPFHHASKSTLGIDCRGLVWFTYRRAGIELPDTDGRKYTADWWKHTKEERLLNIFLQYFDYTSDPKIGDILLLRLFSIHVPINHCGIYIGNNSFIHSYSDKSGKGVHTQDLDYKWKRRFICYLTYKGN